MVQKVSNYNYNATDRSDRIWHVIECHRPQSETYALKYGSIVVALPTVFTSFTCQRYFNKRFKIGGRSFFTFFPMLVPAIGTGLIHRKLIEEDVLFENISCRGCTEFKIASVQFVTGVLWSFLLSSFSACMVGSLRKTIYVPPIEKYPLETIKLLGKHFTRFAPTAIALAVGNFAFTLALTYEEIRQYQNLKLRLLVRLTNFDSEVSPAEFGEFSSEP